MGHIEWVVFWAYNNVFTVSGDKFGKLVDNSFLRKLFLEKTAIENLRGSLHTYRQLQLPIF